MLHFEISKPPINRGSVLRYARQIACSTHECALAMWLMVLESESVSDAGAWLALRDSPGLPASHLALIEPVKVADLPERAAYVGPPAVVEHCQAAFRYWQSLCQLGQCPRHVS